MNPVLLMLRGSSTDLRRISPPVDSPAAVRIGLHALTCCVKPAAPLQAGGREPVYQVTIIMLTVRCLILDISQPNYKMNP